MAGRGPGSSPQSLTVLQRAARLYEGERWWLSALGEVRGLMFLDGGEDLVHLRQALVTLLAGEHGFTVEAEGGVENGSRRLPRQGSPRQDCQVTIEERTQLFGFLKKG